MKKFFLLTSLLASTVLLVECAKKTAPGTGEKTAAEQITDAKKNYTDDQRMQGQTLFQDHCKECHRLHQPEEHNVAKWDNVLPGMIRRAHLTDDQGALVRAYIIANAKQS